MQALEAHWWLLYSRLKPQVYYSQLSFCTMNIACLTTTLKVNLYVHLIKSALFHSLRVILKRSARDIDAIMQYICCKYSKSKKYDVEN
jgi:hypothetical protein